MLNTVKTVTTREFLRAPTLTKSLRPGQTLLVTSSGKPDFVVTKVGERPRKTAEDLRQEALELSPDERPKVDAVAILRKPRR